jgi:F-type H+-transporting ATPase subunit a
MSDTLQTVSDSLQSAGGARSGDNWIMHHIMDGNVLDFKPFFEVHLPTLHLFGYSLPITKHVVFMWVVAILLILILRSAATRYRTSFVPRGMTNVLEIFILFVRDEIAKSTIGKGYEKFLPYLLTVFFFILFSNFLGLIPFTATVTSNITVTAVLATISFLTIQLGGMQKNGVFGYFKGLIPHGIPVVFLPVIGVVEILGLFTKPFALAIRLFANMTAGHIVIYALFSLIFVMKSYGIAFLSVPMALFVYFLEILVALLQAYIFTMLSSLFIGMAVHQDH